MAQRTMQLNEKQRRFLEENPFVGVVTTLREDGSPHPTVVWVDVLEDGTPSFNTETGRAKPRHIEHDPRVSLLVADPRNAYRWVAVSGRAEMTMEGAPTSRSTGSRRSTWARTSTRGGTRRRSGSRSGSSRSASSRPAWASVRQSARHAPPGVGAGTVASHANRLSVAACVCSSPPGTSRPFQLRR